VDVAAEHVTDVKARTAESLRICLRSFMTFSLNFGDRLLNLEIQTPHYPASFEVE
jgi:hypothetical protein